MDLLFLARFTRAIISGSALHPPESRAAAVRSVAQWAIPNLWRFNASLSGFCTPNSS